MYLIGIDLGTTGIKSMIFNYSGMILSQCYIEYGIIYNSDSQYDSHIEQDAGLWWELAIRSVSECIADSGVNINDIKALSISSQGISFVPLDNLGNILHNAISWLDTRAVEQVTFINDNIGADEVYYKTGKRISPNYTLPKIMWIKKNLPDIYKNTHKFLMGLDFLNYKLTGSTVTDYSMASGTMAFNIITKKWDEDIIKACQLDVGKLPEIYCTGIYIGDITAEAAALMGLNTGVKVVMGAQDQKCAALGAGIGEGIATVSLGTSTAVSSIGMKPVFDPQKRVPCFALDDNHWVLESVIGTSCISLKWLKNTLFDQLTYLQMDQLAQCSVAGADGLYFYPHMAGATSPYWKDDMRGFLYGISLSTSKNNIVRAFLEGIAFQIKINIDIQEEINDSRIKEIRIFGGGSNSEIWCQIIADITNKEVSVLYTSEIANLGAAILAGIGMGVYGSSGDILEKIDIVKKKYMPDTEKHLKYNKVFFKYSEIQSKLFL